MYKAGQRIRAGRQVGKPAKVLHVSLYGDHKNLGTLFSALHALNARSPGSYCLQITAGIEDVESGPWFPNLNSERDALRRLRGEGVAADLGPQPYASLPELYAAADVFVFPSYTESFGQPLVEAMASGLPIVAADVPINREICGEAAVYFQPFEPESCATEIARVVSDANLASRLGRAGGLRAETFTWARHIDVLWRALRGETSVP
jgi:glycosyltransferase involved in cell wall biosynthesis